MKHTRLHFLRSCLLPRRVSLDQRDTEGRLPPCKLPLAPLSLKIPEEAKTTPSIWTAATISDAWRAFDESLRSLSDDRLRQSLLTRDLIALSGCTTSTEIEYLMGALPVSLRQAIQHHQYFSMTSVEEIFVHLGQDVEVRGFGWQFSIPPPTESDFQMLLQKIGRFADNGRGNITSTLHRVSCWKARRGEIIGVTIRVGKFVPNCASALLPLAVNGNLLLISRPGAGKTTMLRDLAASLARLPSSPRVVVVDTSNEIGGDCVIPLPYLGRARRVQVPRREDQLRIMTEVLQNHTPEYIVVDEIGTLGEAEAAWSISQRGIKLVATCHGETLPQLLQNRELNLLVGGVTQAFLSNEERRLRNKVRKSILERPHSSPFTTVVELPNRETAFVYKDVNKAVDIILNDEDAKLHTNICGEIQLRAESVPRALNSSVRKTPISPDEDGYAPDAVRLTEHHRGHNRHRKHGRTNQSPLNS